MCIEISELKTDSEIESVAPIYARAVVSCAMAPKDIDYNATGEKITERINKIKKWLADKSRRILLAKSSDGKIVGFSHFEFYTVPFGIEERRNGFVHMMYVLSEHRRKSIGKIMMNKGEKWIISNGGNQMYMHLNHRGREALPIFERLGFFVEGHKMSKRVKSNDFKPNITIREAQSDSGIDFVARYYNETDVMYDGLILTPEYIDRTRKELSDELVNEEFKGNLKMFMAVNEKEEIIGFHYVGFFPEDKTASIFKLFVLPEYRQRGIAKQLKLYAENWLASKGATELFSCVHAEDKRMLEINRKVGFEDYGYVIRENL